MTSYQQPSLSHLFSMLSCLFGLTALLLGSALIARAQEGATPKRGFHPTTSYALTDLETINTTNGNLILNVPIAAAPTLSRRPSGRQALAALQ